MKTEAANARDIGLFYNRHPKKIRRVKEAAMTEF